MTVKMTRLRNGIVIVLLIEFVLALLGYIFISSKTSLVLATYIFIKNIIMLALIFYASSLINENNISVSEVLNDEAKNAFIFGGLGLIKYDKNRNISWTSDLFTEMKINIVGKKLLEWQPLLASLFEDDDIKVVDINSRKFEVYNSKESRMLYLKDVSDYIEISKEFEDQQICVAYITVDNYDESIEQADEQTAASIQSTSRQVILDWAKDNGVVLKRYKSDGYIAVFNERTYRKQVEDKFKILDIFKEQAEQLGQVMTLSIGIGRGSNILRELDELAFSALSLAYSRGGDQATVKSNDEPIRYFGGNSESYEKSNMIRARVIAQTLAGIIKKSDNVLIMGHKQSDFDSFGASIAMYAMCKAYGKKTYIIIDYDSLEEKTKTVATNLCDDERYRGVFISPLRAQELNMSNTLLVIVDNHKPSLAIDSNILDIVSNKVVIDHHRRGEEFVELPLLTYLEPAASSTVELIVELFEYQKEEICVTEREATIMYTGMLIDTNYFRTRVGTRTFQAAAKLKELQANVGEAYKYLEDDYDTTLTKLSITQTAYRYGEGILIAFGKLDKIYSRTLLAKAGNELLGISGVKAVFIVGKTGKEEISISARSTRDINVQLIMEKLGGGGHFSMAACQLEMEDVTRAINLLEEAVNMYLDERKSE
ncbi:DHH family phosphoesterase [Thomasclavelia cocleata]|uniref:Cyclic-di-AMP phosphodiesterase n=1 Tax=Thomasclavelia cocleata TaxID=69824 RepID=A0A1I0F405_9FIRM|nr:DHH family phosphoesterase [Thomasclavelia cocleata]MCR1960691.1 DHH family phosphoesterase [Thomasclavelia cocleata]NDO41363.1 DHH family phosphoesterase [Thomasclavelia cocleata]PJN81763.1 DHH family phosphoesterase [Thomasclavelia cocleata]SET52545.1 c-di-AMP phosphodiesterase, consists of a GGDEF-like and DHH domains [Thomasclavelia cocleata]